MLLIFAGIGTPTVAVGVDAGSSISGGYFSKGKWHKLKKEIEHERALERELAQRVKRRLDLTPLEKAQRELRKAQAAFDKAHAAVTNEYHRSAVANLKAATARLAEAKSALAGLHDAKAHRAARAERERELAAKQARELAEATELARQRGARAIKDAQAAAAGMHNTAQHLSAEQIRSAALRALLEARNDDEEAIALLLLHG